MIEKDALYPVMDRVPQNERKALGLTEYEGSPMISLGFPARGVHAQWTGEKRCPKKGEWYLSGSIIEAYCAPNDLSTPFHIAKLVRTQTRTVTITEIIDEPNG